MNKAYMELVIRVLLAEGENIDIFTCNCNL